VVDVRLQSGGNQCHSYNMCLSASHQLCSINDRSSGTGIGLYVIVTITPISYQSQLHADRERLEAFKMWVWRRMGRIIWVDKVTNAEVLQNVQETGVS